MSGFSWKLIGAERENVTYFLLGILVGFLIAIASMWWLLWYLGK